MHELPPDPDDFLALARQAQNEPSADVRARVLGGVVAALAAGAVIAGTAPAAAATAVGLKARWSLGVAAKLAAAATVCAVAVGALVIARPHTPDAAPHRAPKASAHATAPAEAPAILPPVADEAARVRGPEPAPIEPARMPARVPPSARAAPRAAVPVAQPPSLAAELALLDVAERALDEGAPARALRLLARHRARYAQSSLREERDGLTLIARCMMDRGAAVGAATEFFARAKNSVLQARIESACGGTP